MQRFRDEHRELAALFQALQVGAQGKMTFPGNQEMADLWIAGRQLFQTAQGYYATQGDIAAGLRLVADAIDPPSAVEARREIAETLGPSMLTPDEWEARLTARNRERDNHRIGCPDYDPPDAVNPYAKPYDDALAAHERLNRPNRDIIAT